MADIDNSKLMVLLTTALDSLLLSQEHIQEKRKQRRIFEYEREIVKEHIIQSQIISVLTDKEDFRKYLRMNTSVVIL